MTSRATHPKPHLRSWTEECDGYEVRGSDGLIGWVEGVALLIRPAAAHGTGHELVSVRVEDVRAVVPECRQILVD